MGNCVQSGVCAKTGKQLIKVVRNDGKMLEYTSPLVVRDLLRDSDYQQNLMVVHSENTGYGLPQDYKLMGGENYYLIPSHVKADHKDRSEDVGSSSAGAVKAENVIRLKIVVSKKQLKALLSDGFQSGRLVEELVGKQLRSQALYQGTSCVAAREWRPCLDRIPEVN